MHSKGKKVGYIEMIPALFAGGFLLNDLKFLESSLSLDVMEANFFARQVCRPITLFGDCSMGFLQFIGLRPSQWPNKLR